MLSLINSYRSQNGVATLGVSTSLARAALWKSADMALNHYFAHDDLGRGWLQRIADCGYGSINDGEDLAAGNADAQHTFDQWRTSPPHNANLLSSTFHAIGVGRAQSAGGDWYWTADFGPSGEADGVSSGAAAALPASASTRSTFAVGGSAIVNAPNDCLHVRASPSLTAPVSSCLADGAEVLILDGPVNADGYIWWSTSGGWLAGQYLKSPP